MDLAPARDLEGACPISFMVNCLYTLCQLTEQFCASYWRVLRVKWAGWQWGFGVTCSGNSLKATACPATETSQVSVSSGVSESTRALSIWWWPIRRKFCSSCTCLSSSPHGSWLHLSSELLVEIAMSYPTLNSFIFQKIPSWSAVTPLEHDAWRRWWRVGKFVRPTGHSTRSWEDILLRLMHAVVGKRACWGGSHYRTEPPEACGPGFYEMGNTNKASAVWNVRWLLPHL